MNEVTLNCGHDVHGSYAVVEEEPSGTYEWSGGAGQAGAAGPLLPSVSIEALLVRREALRVIVDQIGALVAKGDELAANGGFESLSRFVDSNRYDNHRANVATAEGRAFIMKALDAQAWRFLLNESGIRSFMSASKRKEWDDEISSGKVPELNRETIVGTFAQLYESRVDMLEQGVVEVFKKLSWHYMTNQPVAFGKKIINNYAVSCGFIAHGFADKVDDLLRLFHKVDGKPELDHRVGAYHLLSEAMREHRDYVDEYVHIRVYRKAQTAHITFKRPDLVIRMNQIIAKTYPGALPPARP